MTKDILAALAVFHLDTPDAPWAAIKERLSFVALNALSLAHTDASLSAYESIYGDLQENLSLATAHMPLSLDRHRGTIGAQRILEASLKRLKGDSKDLVDIVDSLDGIVGSGPAQSLKATQEALHWDDLYPVYLKEKAGDIKQATLDGYESNYKQVSEALEVVGVTNLRVHTRSDLIAMRDELLESRKASTVNNLITQFTSVMTWAVDNDYIAKAYTSKLKLAKGAESSRIPFERSQVETLMAHAETLPTDSWERWGLSLLAVTGARAREITQLNTKDIQEIEGFTCVSIREEAEGQSVKNKYSVRVVPLVDGALGFDLEAFKAALAGPKPPLPTYHEVNNIQARKKLGAVLKEVLPNKSEHQTLHSLRHHMASSFKTKGVPVAYAQALLGHSTGTLAYDTYGGTSIPVASLAGVIEGALKAA
ncbi:tyrosine-type recombinase/integrase [Pseudomonas hormoni]|uniref:Tyrosine-type recombinase/integrase n=1 Tax=Pseudomonas hormoni TaxID=3093767 RepID=A0ABX8EQ62_9PSED|nr:tyrosine-type recombinase/integrase [Pseudomonas hormoni]QVW21450.1 tyrosine-type recombinase/integrase [Pseudomonas hormoni]